MAQCSSPENLSDDEIFFGKLTLKEVKKRLGLLPDNRRQTIMCGTENVKVSNDESVNIIETHSEPDMCSVRDTVTSLDYSNASFASRASMGWDIKSDDSFLKIEKTINELCISRNKNKKEQLDNTLEAVEFILNDAPLHDNRNKTVPIVSEKGTDEIVSEVTDSLKNCSEVKNENVKTTNIANVDTKGLNCTKNCIEGSNGNVGTINTTNIETKVIDCTISCKEVINENVQTSNTTNVDSNSHIKIEISHETPAKTFSSLKKYIQNDKIEGISTPLTEIKQTNNVLMTPKNPILKKNQTPSSKKTPRKTNAFQHIVSPVASYIKKCPQVPLFRDVYPTKPLPGTSSIPKFIKKSNDYKEKGNVLLPSIAYKNAKKTKMITIPDKEKLPQSPQAKKMTSSLPKPVVIKHVHREVSSVKKPLISHQEDSFDNLSLHQADVSVCTEKSAVSK